MDIAIFSQKEFLSYIYVTVAAVVTAGILPASWNYLINFLTHLNRVKITTDIIKAIKLII